MNRNNYQGHFLFWWYNVICKNQEKGTVNSWRKVSEDRGHDFTRHIILCRTNCHQWLPSSLPHLQLLWSSCPSCETSVSIGHGWQGFGRWRPAEVASVERSVALPQIHCRTQLSPSAKLVVSPEKCMRRRAGKAREREEETKGGRSSRGNTKISRGGKAPFWSKHPHCNPWRTMPGQMDMPNESAACGEPTLEQRKTMRRKQQQQRGTPMYWPPFIALHGAWTEEGSWEWRSEVEPGEGGRKNVALLSVSLVSNEPKLCYCQEIKSVAKQQQLVNDFPVWIYRLSHSCFFFFLFSPPFLLGLGGSEWIAR